MRTPRGDVVILSGAGCSGKTAISVALKVHHGFARVSVWTMRLQHLIRWEDRDQGDDYEPGCQIAEAACRIYAARGRRSTLEDVGDREAVEIARRFRAEATACRLVSIVADESLIRERLALRDCAPTEFAWLVELNRQIAARPLIAGELRVLARDWIGRADELARRIAA